VLLTYPAPPGTPGAWRKVKVQVRGPGTPRTASGYYVE
jgi:hypothetical protein